MKQSRFTEEQIIGILKEHETGVSVADLCRKHGVSDATVYKWKARFGGMDVSEAKRLKALEDENANPGLRGQTQGRLALYRAGKADAERLYRKLQRAAAPLSAMHASPAGQRTNC